jgi:hypothetical protein
VLRPPPPIRRLAFAAVALGALLVAGCGSTAPLNFKGKSRPSPPVDVSVYVNDRGISISPSSVGAGLVVFYVTNQATRAELITVFRTHHPDAVAVNSGDLPANGTATVTADLRKGHYDLTGSGFVGGNPAPIAPAVLRIGPPRQAGDSALLQP